MSSSSGARISHDTAEHFPPGLGHAFLFATFNGLSFQIILSSPMVLYAKTLGASATVLGIIVGMMPLLVIFQIPAANYIPRVGFKRFVYGGWGMRVMFIFVMALVPLTYVFLNNAAQLSLMLFLLFCFNLSRGISSCAWLPWITSLVPASIRGRYLAWDAGCVQTASFLAFIVAGFVLGSNPSHFQFSLIFVFSAIMGATSLSFLKRIPDGPGPTASQSSGGRIPWLEMARYRPFKKLLVLNLAWSAAYGGMTAFTVAYLKSEAGLSEGTILYVTSVMFLGGLVSPWFGTRMDRLGSKPVMTFAFSGWLLICTGWALLAGGIFHAGWPLILSLELAMGLGAAMFNMSNVRLAMAISPEMGRNHFFAIFSVVANVSLGISPVLWGLMIDVFHGLNTRTGPFEWNRYSLFFSATGLMFVVVLACSRKLEEPAAANVQKLIREIVIGSPYRMWVRLFGRD